MWTATTTDPTSAERYTGGAYYGAHLAGDVKASEFGRADSATDEVAPTLAQPLVRHLQRPDRPGCGR